MISSTDDPGRYYSDAVENSFEQTSAIETKIKPTRPATKQFKMCFVANL